MKAVYLYSRSYKDDTDRSRVLRHYVIYLTCISLSRPFFRSLA